MGTGRPFFLLMALAILLPAALAANPGNSSAAQETDAVPSDTISLWEGQKIRFAKDVSFFAFRPEKPNGISVIVCPGGSYHWLDRKTEGLLVGEWLKEHGMTLQELLNLGYEYGVGWQDGSKFLIPDTIRMNLALPTSRVKEAFDRLDKYVFNK